MTTGRAVLLDRDGVINALVPDPDSGLPEGPLRIEDVELLPGVTGALHELRSAGYLLACVTNQPAAAKEKATVIELGAIQQRIVELLAADGISFDATELCLHHPDGTDPGLSGPCDCRKPEPGMLLWAAAELAVEIDRCWMVGDNDSDVEAGRRAGCRSILIEHTPSAHKRGGSPATEYVASDLAGAVQLLLGADSDCYDPPLS